MSDTTIDPVCGSGVYITPPDVIKFLQLHEAWRLVRPLVQYAAWQQNPSQEVDDAIRTLDALIAGDDAPETQT